MMPLLIDIVSWALIAAGSAFVVIGAVGVVRMPDVYTRMHAASVSETLGAGLLVAGFILQAGFTLVTLKLLFILGLFFFTAPVVTHALAQAALHEDIEPVLSDDRRNDRATDTVAGQPEKTNARPSS